MEKKHQANFFKRLSYALHGLTAAYARESSFKTQAVCAVLLAAFCFWMRPPAIWCALFTLSAAIVISLELLNSAVEALTDRLHPGRHPEIGFVKDCLAGAVLVSGLAALIVFVCYLRSRHFQPIP